MDETSAKNLEQGTCILNPLAQYQDIKLGNDFKLTIKLVSLPTAAAGRHSEALPPRQPGQAGILPKTQAS